MPESFNKNLLEVLPHPDAYLDRWREYQLLAKKEHDLEEQMSLLTERLEIYRETNEEVYNKLLDTLVGFDRVLEQVTIQKQAAYKSFSAALRAIKTVRALNEADRKADKSF